MAVLRMICGIGGMKYREMEDGHIVGDDDGSRPVIELASGGSSLIVLGELQRCARSVFDPPREQTRTAAT
jgi:hypothetical protein